MKKSLPLLTLLLFLPLVVGAQSTLRIVSNGVTWLTSLNQLANDKSLFMVSRVGDGYLLSTNRLTYKTSNTAFVFDNTPIESDVVDIDFSRNSVVEADLALAEHLTVSLADGLLEINAATAIDREITYRLRGTFAGSVILRGGYKSKVELHGVDITATGNYPALWVDNGKRIDIVAKAGTTNTFADAATNLKKAALFVKGHVELKGGGTINVTGNAKHAYASNEYTHVRESFGTLNVLGAAGDGMHIGQYLKVDGGNLRIAETKGDGIDVSYTYTDANETTINANDADNGKVFINAGKISITLAANETKALSSDADMTILGGTIAITLDGNGTRGLSVGKKSKGYIGHLLVEARNAATAPLNLTIKGSGTNTDNEKIRAVRVTGNATHNSGEVFIELPGTSNPNKVDGTATGDFAK